MGNRKRTEKTRRNPRGRHAGKIRQVLERVDQGIHDTAEELRSYIPQHPEFVEIGERMLQKWEAGSETSLRG